MIRQAGTADIPVIRSIAHRTWPHAYYPAILSAEQLAYMLELLYSEKALTEAMEKKGQRFFLLERDGEFVGFTSCTPHQGGTSITHLNKLYVLPSEQGTGSGKALLERAIAFAKEQGDRAVELNVNKRNKAISFYERHGFRIDRGEVIDIGQGYVMDDHVMVRHLTT